MTEIHERLNRFLPLTAEQANNLHEHMQGLSESNQLLENRVALMLRELKDIYPKLKDDSERARVGELIAKIEGF